MSMIELIEGIQPLTTMLQGISLENPEKAKEEIEKKAPFQGPMIQAIAFEAKKGAKEGWLLPKENAGIRFGRISKDLDGFSVDAVFMKGPGPKHRHGNGEIDLCFSTQDTPQFDGHPEGWVVYGPGSVHTPTVSKGEMLILYFLPGGVIEFL